MTQITIDEATYQAMGEWTIGGLDEIADIRRLRLEPGDTIVILSNLTLSAGHRARIRAQVSDLFPKNRVLVLDSGTQIVVVGEGPR